MRDAPAPTESRGLLRLFQRGRIALPALVLAGSLICVTHARADAPPVSTDAQPDAVASWVERTVAEPESESKIVRRRGHKEPAIAKVAKADYGAGLTNVATLVWPLIAVLVTIGLLAMLARKWMSGTARFSPDGVIRLLARQYLSNKQSLALVRVGQRLVLLGLTPDRVSSLCEIRDPEEVSALVAAAQRGAPGSFSAALNLFNGKLARPEEDDRFAAEPGDPVLPNRTAATRAGVRDLLDRLRAFSGEKASAEST